MLCKDIFVGKRLKNVQNSGDPNHITLEVSSIKQVKDSHAASRAA